MLGEMCRLREAAIRGGAGCVTQTGVTPVTMEVGSFIAITIVGKLNSPSKNYFGCCSKKSQARLKELTALIAAL